MQIATTNVSVFNEKRKSNIFQDCKTISGITVVKNKRNDTIKQKKVLWKNGDGNGENNTRKDKKRNTGIKKQNTGMLLQQTRIKRSRKIYKRIVEQSREKNGWQMSEVLGESTPYKIQKFINCRKQDASQFRDESVEPVVDETSFLKHEKMSAGVQWQYGETTRRIKNCQIGVFMNYVVSDKFCCND